MVAARCRTLCIRDIMEKCSAVDKFTGAVKSSFQCKYVSKSCDIQKMFRCMTAEDTVSFKVYKIFQILLIERMLPDSIYSCHIGMHQSFTMERNCF